MKEKELDEFYHYIRISKTKGEYIYYNPYCKDCEKNKNAEWRKNNPDKRRESIKKDNANPEKQKQIRMLNKKRRENGEYRNWQRNNKNKLITYRENRQHKNHEITAKEWEACKKYFNYECAYCGLHISEHFNKYADELIWTDFHKEHVDHNGLNDLSNCIPSCKSCNSSKYTHELNEWFNEQNPIFDANRLERIHKWLNEDYLKYKEIPEH